jgi:hypothetical protein
MRIQPSFVLVWFAGWLAGWNQPALAQSENNPTPLRRLTVRVNPTTQKRSFAFSKI